VVEEEDAFSATVVAAISDVADWMVTVTVSVFIMVTISI